MKAIIGILTAQPYVERRRGVLRTWARDIEADPDLDYVFLIGDPTLAVPQREANRLMLPCPDDYDSLPQKTRWFCVWLSTMIELPWDIAMKVDDDTYLQVDRLKRFLTTAAESNVDVYGADDGNHFHGGAGYTINRPAAEAIAEHVTDPKGLEDWKACAALHAAKLTWANEPRFCFDKTRLPMPANEQITAHYCSPVRMRLLSDDFKLGSDPVAKRIPKILHHIWLGGEMPREKIRLRQTWIDRHPDWEHRLWTEAEIADLTLTNSTPYSMATTPAQRCHIARYEILEKLGGVYVDCDVECYRSIDGFRNSTGFAAAEDDEKIGCAVIGCQPGDQLMRRVIELLPHSFGNSGDVAKETGSGLFTQAFFADDHDWRLHYWHTFYPRHWSGRENGPLDRAYCQHHWDASWK